MAPATESTILLVFNGLRRVLASEDQPFLVEIGRNPTILGKLGAKIVQTVVDLGRIGVDLRLRARGVPDHLLGAGAIGALDRLGDDRVGLPILEADDRGLAHGSAAGTQLLVPVLVILLAAQMGFVGFHRSVQRVPRGGERLADAMPEEPSGFLRDPEHLGELDAGDSLGWPSRKKMAIARMRNGSLLCFMRLPVRSEKYFPQVPQRYGMGLAWGTSRTQPTAWQWKQRRSPSGQRSFSNQRLAACSSGNLSNSSTGLIARG